MASKGLRAFFLSNRDEVKAGEELTIILKTVYDKYRLLPPSFYFSVFYSQFTIVSLSAMR